MAYAKMLFPGQYIQGSGVVSLLPKLIGKMGGIGLCYASAPVADKFAPFVADCRRSADLCTLDDVEAICGDAREAGATVLIAAGGGQTVDACKAASDAMGLPIIVCPTTASCDAPCSSVAMVNDAGGRVKKVVVMRRSPDVVLVDLDIVISAPPRHFAAGIADALSTWYEARSCEATGAPSVCGAGRTATAMMIAKLSHDIIMRYGREAYADCLRGVVSDAFSKVVEANILLSGVGFESCGIAAPHGLGNTASVLDRTHSMMHGEKVAFGILCSLRLNKAPESEIREVAQLFTQLGLPVTLRQLGLEDVTEEELDRWVAAACSRHEYVRNEPADISEASIRQLILDTDLYGRSFIK